MTALYTLLKKSAEYCQLYTFLDMLNYSLKSTNNPYPVCNILAVCIMPNMLKQVTQFAIIVRNVKHLSHILRFCVNT